MERVQHSLTFLRRRKMLLVMPLLVLPFVTLAFWALGGGKAAAETSKQTANEKGLNLQLPNANLKADKDQGKMDYYEKAEADSAKLKARIKDDPYFKLKASLVVADTSDETGNDSEEETKLNALPYTRKINSSAGEKQVYDKLKQINQALENAKTSSGPTSTTKEITIATPALHDKNVDGPGKMMQTMKEPANGNDTEMNQINAMLEKVMDIQHPERLNEKYQQIAAAQKGIVYAVTVNNENNNGFYGESNLNSAADVDGTMDADSTLANKHWSNAIEAVVHETQTLVNGATVKLRLLS